MRRLNSRRWRRPEIAEPAPVQWTTPVQVSAIRKWELVMDAEELKSRTKAFALPVIRLSEALPKERTDDVIGRQLLRSAMSVGAKYRAACRARTQVEFAAKIGIVEEDADESAYWLELIVESGLLPAARVEDLLAEANELVAIFVASARTAKRR
jgi:four helix bundle protein